ncbi:desampylase [Halorientalis brevis]|uniref:Desampylase n=1 Tax=Halorientalis brevis TaxID=1126241 RepID=A0ABD6CBT5_9EURY|nr:desampylase [Halorientalis brevis]
MLVLSRGVYDDVVEHARTGSPEEVCGILGGEFGADESHAGASYRTDNAADAPRTEYAIDPEEQFAVMDDVEDAGRDVVGFYHSHPQGPPRPSQTDRARATWEGYTYVIVSLDGAHPYVGAWRWTGDAFSQEVVAVR